MNDVVGLIATDSEQGRVGFITCGRLFGAVAEDRLIDAIRPHLASGFSMRNVTEVVLCDSLRDISRGVYFYEALIEFASERIPFEEGKYRDWLEERKSDLLEGRGLYSVGLLD